MDSEVREPRQWQHQHSAPVAKVFFDKLKQERNVVQELVALN